jgi:hypothetical protein
MSGQMGWFVRLVALHNSPLKFFSLSNRSQASQMFRRVRLYESLPDWMRLAGKCEMRLVSSEMQDCLRKWKMPKPK